eukprot:2364976-Pyramimonas_sp.AAC.1
MITKGLRGLPTRDPERRGIWKSSGGLLKDSERGDGRARKSGTNGGRLRHQSNPQRGIGPGAPPT